MIADERHVNDVATISGMPAKTISGMPAKPSSLGKENAHFMCFKTTPWLARYNRARAGFTGTMPPAHSAHAAEATANRWSREILGGSGGGGSRFSSVRLLLTILFGPDLGTAWRNRRGHSLSRHKSRQATPAQAEHGVCPCVELSNSQQTASRTFIRRPAA